jgi:APA family basic amino acid/polyamine antiporter
VGIAWMLLGFLMYIVYRRRINAPWTQTVTLERTAPIAEVDIAYTNILVPIVATEASEEMMVTAGKLAADANVKIEAINVVEVPVELPLEARMPREERAAEELLAHARAIAEEYGAEVVTRTVRGRQAGRAIVDEARAVGAEVIMMGVAERRRASARIFGRTVDYVLHNAPCRVVVSSDRRAPGTSASAALGAAAASAVSGVQPRAPGTEKR